MGAASFWQDQSGGKYSLDGRPGDSLGCKETRFVMNFVSEATSPQSSVFAQACLVLSCYSPLTWLLRTLLWEGSEGVGWLETSLGWEGTGKRLLVEWVGFERLCCIVWEGNLVCSIGRAFGKERGKDECLMEKTFFIKLPFKKPPPHCRRAEIKWREREEVSCGITGHDYNPASGLTCSADAFTSLVYFFSSF